jgi:hypothetical protein
MQEDVTFWPKVEPLLQKAAQAKAMSQARVRAGR